MTPALCRCKSDGHAYKSGRTEHLAVLSLAVNVNERRCHRRRERFGDASPSLRLDRVPDSRYTPADLHTHDGSSLFHPLTCPIRANFSRLPPACPNFQPRLLLLTIPITDYVRLPSSPIVLSASAEGWSLVASSVSPTVTCAPPRLRSVPPRSLDVAHHLTMKSTLQ